MEVISEVEESMLAILYFTHRKIEWFRITFDTMMEFEGEKENTSFVTLNIQFYSCMDIYTWMIENVLEKEI